MKCGTERGRSLHQARAELVRGSHISQNGKTYYSPAQSLGVDSPRCSFREAVLCRQDGFGVAGSGTLSANSIHSPWVA